MKMKHFLAAILISSVAISATAQKFDLKGYRIGMSKAELTEVLSEIDCRRPPVCTFSQAEESAHTTGYLNTFADRLAYLWVFSISESGKVERILISLKAESMKDILSALTAKYGKPGGTTTNPVTTLMGVKARQTTVTWRRGDEVLSVSSPSGTVTEMDVLLYTESAEKKRLREKQVRAAKDL